MIAQNSVSLCHGLYRCGLLVAFSRSEYADVVGALVMAVCFIFACSRVSSLCCSVGVDTSNKFRAPQYRGNHKLGMGVRLSSPKNYGRHKYAPYHEETVVSQLVFKSKKFPTFCNGRLVYSVQNNSRVYVNAT
ncbi:unnamed protein product [Ixodes persulcatus]